jgi:anti-sigma-K factor RskA
MSTDLHTLSGAYAINALSDEEARLFATHLEGCPACRDEVRELQEADARMGASEAVVPPAALKRRVLEAADRQAQLPPLVSAETAGTTDATPDPTPDPTTHPTTSPTAGRATAGDGPTPIEHARSRRWTRRLTGAAVAAVLVVVAGFGVSELRQDDAPPRVAASVAKVFEAPDAHEATVKTSNGGKVTVATSQRLGRMALETDGLPALENGQVYQMWAIRQGAPSSAGVIENLDHGAAMEMPAGDTTVAITIEPAGGSEQPTSAAIARMDPKRV